MTAKTPQRNGLPKSRAALAQARRVLDELPSRELSPTAYCDHVPYVLDRLDNVWRMINGESEGRRTQAFGRWWSSQWDGARKQLRDLRVAELKKNVQTTGIRLTSAPIFIRRDSDGRFTVHRSDGTEVRQRPGPSFLMADTVVESAEWFFVAPGLGGQPVQPVLEAHFARLADDVLPTAERLLAASGIRGDTAS